MEKNEHLIFGIHPVTEAIKAGKTIEKLYLQKDISGPQIGELRNLIKENNISCSHVPIQRIERYTKGNHQGVVGFITPIEIHDIEELLPKLIASKKNLLIMLLDKITDVRNFGAICRTAECAGVDTIIIPKRESVQINADGFKTSAGALHRIPICRVDNLTDTVYLLKEHDIQIVACTEKATETIYNGDYTKPTAIVMGNEEKGISNQLLKISDFKASIPMAGSISSLNVSVAAGIILYEAVKQRV